MESPTDYILPTFLNIKPEIKDTGQINAELIEIKQLIMSQINVSNSETPKRKLTKETYSSAKKDSKKLYYEDGWEIDDIKKYLIETYNMNRYTADDIFHKSINLK